MPPDPSSTPAPRRYDTMLVTLTFPPVVGGIETMMLQIVRNLPGAVVVMAPWEEGCEAFDREQPFRVIRVRSPRPTPLRSLVFIARGAAFLLRHRVGHLQSSNIFAGLISMVLSRLFRIPYSVYALAMEVAILNTPLRSAGHRWLFRRVLRRAIRVFSISDFTSAEVEKCGVPRERIHKIPNGIDTTTLDRFDREAFGRFRERVDRDLGLRGRPVVLTVARLVPRKGHDQVIRAMAQLDPERHPAVYVIVGSGPERPRLERLVAGLDLADRVRFAGRVPDEDLVLYYHLADILILASRHIRETADVEGFGLVFLEANYCGKPVIGGNSGGIPDAIVDGVTGFLVDPLDPSDIARKLATLLADPALRQRMGEAGRRRVIEQFSHRNTVESVLAGLAQASGLRKTRN